MTDLKAVENAASVAISKMFELGKEICEGRRVGWDGQLPAFGSDTIRDIAIKQCEEMIDAAKRLTIALQNSRADTLGGALHIQQFGRGIRPYWPPSLADVIEPKGFKPHMGRIQNWRREDANGGIGYIIVGRFLDHDRLKGSNNAHTSYVVKHDEKTGEIETRNSRYTLVGPESFRDAA